MRTAPAALWLTAMIGLAVIVTSKIGGLDRHELAGLMGAPAPEQVAVSNDVDDADRDPFDGPVDADDCGAPDPDMPPGAMPPSATGAPAAAAPQTLPPAVETPASPPDPSPDPAPMRTPRNVTAPGMTPAPALTGPLEREAIPKKPPAPPRWKAFSPVVVREAGLLDIGQRHVRLAGIRVPDDDRLCHPAETDEAAGEIACAKLALAALRRRVRALGVECRVSANDTTDPLVAPCRIGSTDLGQWLIEQGWAEAAAKAPDGYKTAETEARCFRRGIWQAGPPPADCLQN
ncbi:MAG: thermonuclease family protein [Rhizobiales bacterium]|nr:thermonuclease family protein [Hyphomicrobiales bacterium]